MKFLIFNIFFIFTLIGCSLKSTNRYKSCNCCENTYHDIEDAIKCISQNPKPTSHDNRLFLFAFVRNDLEKNKKLGWDIIKDQDIIKIAKRNYLLITFDANNLQYLKGYNELELIERINKHKDEQFFVITNQAFIPFAYWSSDENKNIIIDRLLIGNGP